MVEAQRGLHPFGLMSDRAASSAEVAQRHAKDECRMRPIQCPACPSAKKKTYSKQQLIAHLKGMRTAGGHELQARTVRAGIPEHFSLTSENNFADGDYWFFMLQLGEDLLFLDPNVKGKFISFPVRHLFGNRTLRHTTLMAHCSAPVNKISCDSTVFPDDNTACLVTSVSLATWYTNTEQKGAADRRVKFSVSIAN